ncbi:MAG: SDR family NAD(P)-dependent oxidoreductase, partial [Rhodospirillales bacterium]|nr:SDR family NAD(P)-dependent oxidoreductase [Rhodospirillales bacterium]
MTQSDNSSGALLERFALIGNVVIITGGGGFLGRRHGAVVAELGGIPVLIDIDSGILDAAAKEIKSAFDCEIVTIVGDITSREDMIDIRDQLIDRFGTIDVLINNAANNPDASVIGETGGHWSRLENFSLDMWNKDIAVGLTGALICSQVFGTVMAETGKGVILNISSDLGLISPDQRLYEQPGKPETEQPKKPVSYSVVKSGLIGLTRYLATYWADKGVRANAVAFGGVYRGEDADFVDRLTQLIPLG